MYNNITEICKRTYSEYYFIKKYKCNKFKMQSLSFIRHIQLQSTNFIHKVFFQENY